MSIKKWEVRFELFFDANNIVPIIVEANTERKAKIKAEEKLKKTYECHFPIIRSVRKIT